MHTVRQTGFCSRAPGLRACGILVCLALGTAAAQDYQVPRTENGHPDLGGVWNFNDSTPFTRPERYGDREFLTEEELRARQAAREASEQRRDAREAALADRVLEQPTNDTGAYNFFWSDYDEPFPNRRTSLLVYPENGQLPATRNGVVIQQSPPGSSPCNDGNVVDVDRPVRISWAALSCDRPEDFGLASRCLLFPQSTGPHIKANSYNNNLLIVQTRDHVVIKAELGNDTRIIPLDGRPFPDARLTSWTGSSRGYWDGDTLVVETRHFTDKIASLFQRTRSYGSAADMVLTERFTRVGENAMEYQFSIDDPATFSDRITAITNLSRLDAPIYEFACHEGNYALTGMLRAARMVDAASGNNQGR